MVKGPPRRDAPAAKAPRARKEAAPAPPPEPQRDFLVIYEEDDIGLPDEDVLVMEIETPKFQKSGEIDVQQKLDLDLSNTASRAGTIGFWMTILGAILGFALVIAFGVYYPDPYYLSDGGINAPLVKKLIAFGFMTFVMLLLGTILTHYGRRIQARANLSAVRLIEKTTHQKAGFQN